MVLPSSAALSVMTVLPLTNATADAVRVTLANREGNCGVSTRAVPTLIFDRTLPGIRIWFAASLDVFEVNDSVGIAAGATTRSL